MASANPRPVEAGEHQAGLIVKLKQVCSQRDNLREGKETASLANLPPFLFHMGIGCLGGKYSDCEVDAICTAELEIFI